MSWDALDSLHPEPEKEVTWGDYGRAAAGGAAGIAAGSSGLLRQMFEAGQNPEAAKLFKAVQGYSRITGEEIEGGMTEEGRERLAAGVTTDKFWEHPVSSLALKATGMSPYLVAAAIPGALVGEGVAAMGAVGGTAGWLAAGDVVDEITRKPDKMSDADLRAQSPLYAGFRDQGTEEKEAREQLNQIMVGAKPALAFLLGAGTGVFGPAGNVVRKLQDPVRLAGSKGAGFLGQHGIKASAVEGATTEFAEEGYGGYAAQKSEIEAGLRGKYDRAEIFDRALTGMALGGILGGVTGIGAGRGKGKAKADEIREAEESRRGEEGAAVQVPDREAGIAIPAEDAAAARRKTAKAKGVTVGVDPAIEAALAAEQPAAPKVEPIVPTPAPPTPPVTPQVTPAPVPAPSPPLPDAAQAQQAPTVPPTGPAALPQEVTAPPPQAAPAAHSEQTLTEMARRGFAPEETAQLTPEQVRQVLQQPTPVTGSTAAAQPAPAPNLSTAEPSAPAPVATAPEVSPLGINRTEPGKTGSPPAKKVVLQDISPEGQQKVAATTAAFQQAGEKGKKALAKAQRVAEGPKPKNRGKDEVASLAQRDEQAKAVYDAHREPLGDPFGEDTPVKREVREALALKIQRILDKAAEQGMVPRESLPDDVRIEKKGRTEEQKRQRDMSIPERVGAKGVSPHVVYLRELIGVQQALRSKKFGPASDERARVNQFLTEHNIGDLQSLADRRLEVGRTKKAKRGSAVAAAAGKKDVQSEGAAATRELTDEQKAEISRQMGMSFKGEPSALEQVATAPKISDKSDTPKPPKGKVKAEEIKAKEPAKAAEPVREVQPAKPPMPKKVAEKVAITKESRKEPTPPEPATKPEPKAWKDMNEAERAAYQQEQDEASAKKLGIPVEQAIAERQERVAALGKFLKEDVAEKQQKVTSEVTTPPAGMSEKARHAALRKWLTPDQINELSTKAQIDFLKNPPPVPEAPVKAPPARPKRTEAEIEAEERARENAERVEEIERDEARQREVREELERENAAKAPARPAATQAASAEEAAAFAPVSTSKPKVVTDKRAALKAALKARQEQPGILKMGAMSDLDVESMTDEQIDAMTDEEIAGLLADLERISNEPKKGVSWDSDDVNLWETPLHKAHAVYGHHAEAMPVTLNASDVLRQLDLSHLRGMPKYIQDFVRRRLTEVLGNVKIHIANADLMIDATGDLQAPAGYYHPADTGPGYIAVRSDVMNNRREFTHTVIHEALHAALYHKLNNSKTFQKQIQILMTALDVHTRGRTSRKHAAYALQLNKEGKVDYNSLTAMHEFVAEALSNPKLQQMMRAMKLPADFVQELGLPPAKPQTLWGAFTEKVREVLRLPPGTYNLLHETLQVIGPQLEGVRSEAAVGGRLQPQLLRRMSMDQLQDAAIGKLADTKINTGSKLAAAKRKVATLWDMSGRGEHSSLFGASNPLNRLFDLRAFMERAKSAILDKYGGLKAANAIAQAERKFPEQMKRIKQIAFNASLHDVNLDGDNSHLGKDRLMGIQAKNEIARLQKEWNDPSLDPVRDTVRSAMKFFRDIHNAVSRETIGNILAEGNIHDKALAQRIHTDGLTEADEEAWAGTKLVSALNQVRALKQRQGSFIPFRRYGDYISAAEHELSVPANATKINDNTLQFLAPNHKERRSRAMVRMYLRQPSHTPQGNKLTPAQVRKVWVDKNNPSQIVEGEDVDAVEAYRVSMQTQHVEMHETEADAQNSQDDLKAAGLLNSRAHKREEAYRTDVTNIQSSMGAVLRSLEKQQRYIDADSSQKAAMREMFHDLTLGLSGTTSIKNSMRQRRNVAGESRDLGRVTADYAQMTANHLAKLQYRPQMDAVFKEMREYINDPNRRDNDKIRREEVYKEFQERIYGKAAERADQNRGGFITRALQLTRLSFLAGPSFHLINAHEVATTSLPVVGGRHGFGAAFRAMTDAYNSIGSRGALVAGFKDTVKAYTDDSGFTDYVKLFKDTIGKSKIAGPDKIRRQQDMIDYMDARNLYSNASIFEMAKYANPTGNIAGRAIDRADLMANQVGSAIEAINRTVTGLMAYNLEYKKNGGNHEAAMHYAYSTAHNTMGDYSAWNAAPVFNTQLGRLAFQFKKFPQKTYMLLGNIVGGIAKGDPQAMKQFAGLMVTHGMVAGVLGMPTEPFKLALLAANAVGATGFTPEDYDYAVRKLMRELAGQKGGEILSKGLYRGIGIELSGRMGYDSLLLRGQPKSQKDADLKSFLWDTMAGASASYMLNQVQGAQAAFKGDFATAVEKMSPLRTVGDVTKAIVGATGEKKGPSGKTTQEQFTAWEAAVRALGFTPSSAAEMGALRGTQARQSKRLSANRSELINEWIDASGAKKVDAQRAVQAFNVGRPADEQITQKNLADAARRREREKKVTQHGITTSKRTKAIDELALSVFNP